MAHLLSAAALSVSLALPARAETLVGNWGCVLSPDDGSTRITTTYEPGGQYFRSIEIFGDLEGSTVNVTLNVKGAWRMADAVLTEKPEWIEVTGLSLDGRDVTRDPDHAAMKAEIEGLSKEIPPPARITFTGSGGYDSESPAGNMTCIPLRSE